MSLDSQQAVFGKALREALHLTQPPVGISLCDALPAGVPVWKGTVPAGCRFWEEGTRAVFATEAGDHALCGIGTYTHNLETSTDDEKERAAALKVFASLGYVRPEDLPLIPVLKTRPRYVVYGPLDRLPIVADVVLLFARPEQMLVLSEASQQAEGGAPPALGRPACAIVPQAVNTGLTALSLGCCGARAYLDVLKSDTALYAVPAARLAAFAERVQGLAAANAVLATFHAIRRKEVAEGRRPTIAESLAALQ